MGVLPPFLARGYFTDSTAVDSTVKGYIDDNDSVGNWWKDNIVPHEDETAEITSTTLYLLYQSNCHMYGIRPVDSGKFRRRLNKMIEPSRIKRLRRDGVRQVVYLGYRSGEKSDD
jgi:phage/plasmid-associated DNA primase